MMAILSVMTLDDYLSHEDKSIFDELNLPDGIDKQTLTDNILLKSAEFECLYPDPVFLTKAVGLWGRKWYRTFEKWVAALNIDYAPLENYDRFEDWRDDSSETSSRHSEGTSNNTSSGSGSTTGTGTTENKVSAFDSGDYQPKDMQIANTSGTTSTEDTTFIADSNDDEANASKDFVHSGRIHGNIGVTTSQQMLQQELDIQLWNIYEHITDLFLNEFVLLIY